MNILYYKNYFFYFVLFLSATGFFEKLQRLFYLPLPYVGDIISSIFPFSILIFFFILFHKKQLPKINKFEIYFSLIIILILIIHFLNSSYLNYESISFVSNYIWIFNCYIIFKYILSYDNINKSNFFKIIFYSILFIFFFNLIINLVNNSFHSYNFYNEIIKRAEVTSLTTEGYIISFFFYYLFLNKFFDKQNISYFLLFSLINFFIIFVVESRGLLLFNILSIIYVLIFSKNNKGTLIKKTLISILFLIFIFSFSTVKIGSMFKSTLVGLNKNYNQSYYTEFDNIINSNIYIFNKKNENVLKTLNLIDNNNIQAPLCRNLEKVYQCSEKEIIESLYSKEISYSLSSNTRFFTIKYVLREFLKKPILGISIVNIKKIIVNGDKIHSNLVILISSIGILGIICLTLFIYYIYNQMYEKKVGIFTLFFILYYAFFFDNLIPVIGLALLLTTDRNNIFKYD